MRFKSLYRSVFLLALTMNFMDYAITQLGFTRFPPWWEVNPYVRLLMRMRVDPHIASTIVFAVSLAFIIAAYQLLRGYLSREPYSSPLRHVGRYLWSLSAVKARDLSVFACLALAIVLIIQHSQGFVSWLIIFIPPPLMVELITALLQKPSELLQSIPIISNITLTLDKLAMGYGGSVLIAGCLIGMALAVRAAKGVSPKPPKTLKPKEEVMQMATIEDVEKLTANLEVSEVTYDLPRDQATIKFAITLQLSEAHTEMRTFNVTIRRNVKEFEKIERMLEARKFKLNKTLEETKQKIKTLQRLHKSIKVDLSQIADKLLQTTKW